MKFTKVFNGYFADEVLKDEVLKVIERRLDRGESVPTDQQEMQKLCTIERNKLQRKFELQN